MPEKVLSVFISIIIIIGSLCVSASCAEEFVPVLRFAVASDAHIADSGSDLEEERLAKLFEASYSYAESQSYNKLDGVFFAGDISDNGTSSSMQKFFDIVNNNARSETTVRAVLGNHEFYTESSGAVSRFLEASGYSEADTDFVLGGYHFIMMCPQSGGRGYTNSQISWLKKKLSAAAKEDKSKSKPIFVLQHHNVSGTVYGSDGGTEACFTGRIVTANVYGRALTDYEIEQLYNQYSTFAFIPESGYQFDLQGRKLYGLDLTALTAQNIENAFLNNNLYVETDRRIGTGTEIVLKDSSGEIYDTAEVVIFGDVNGDGWYDGQDATVVSCLANGMLTEGDVSAAEYMAADCNHDGTVDNLDAEILNRAGVLLAGVDQSKSPEELMTDSAYIEYLNLISQNASDDKPEDEQAEGCFKKFIHKEYNFIMVIVNKIKSFFKRLCTV